MASVNETRLTREQIKNMREAHVEAFANKNGGVELLSEGNLLRLANAHGQTGVGQRAVQELAALSKKPRNAMRAPRQEGNEKSEGRHNHNQHDKRPEAPRRLPSARSPSTGQLRSRTPATAGGGMAPSSWLRGSRPLSLMD